MAAGRLIVPGWARALDSDGDPIAAAVSLFDTGTDDLASVYTDASLSIPLANPVQSNSAGRFPAIWADDAVTYDWSVVADYGPPGSPFTGTGLTTASAADTLNAAAAEAAADQAAIDAAIAADALADIIALGEASPDTDPTVIAGKVSYNVLAASGGSALVGHTNGSTGAVLRTEQAKLRDTLDVRDFGVVGTGDEGAKIQAALTAASASGAELLWPAGSYSSSVLLASGPIRIRFLGPVTLTYSSATHIAKFFEIAMTGADTSLLGRFRIDANNKANEALVILNDSVTRANLTLGDIEARNCRMVSGSAFNAGSTGIVVRGLIGKVVFERLWAENITRAAGTGSPSVFGCIGVEISRNGSGAPLQVSGSFIGAKNVNTDDASGSPNRYDCDAVAIFQNDEEGAVCSLGTVLGINAAGRALKLQTYRGTSVNLVSVKRSVTPITDGASDVNLQLGEGSVRQIDIEYSGLADTVHGAGTTCVSSFTSLDRSTAGFGLTNVQNVTIRDLTTGGTSYINQIFAPQNGSVSTVNQMAILKDVQLFGRGAKALVDIGQSGSSGSVKLQLRLDTFMGEIRETVIRSSATPTPSKFMALLSGIWNTGTEVPVLKREDSADMSGSYGKLIDGGANVGVSRITYGNGQPGLIQETPSAGQFVFLSRAYVEGFLYTGYMTAGTEVELPRFGLIEGAGRFTVGSPEFGPLGVYKAGSGSTTITTVEAATGVVVGTGAEPASGDFGIWKVGERMRIKNRSASDRYFIVKFEG